jgi:addiction module RelE/StbE family toxin
MLVLAINYSSGFVKLLKKLPRDILQRAIIKERLFKENPLHPSLRLHSLKGSLEGLFSISINHDYRIIFKRQNNGLIVFISVGKHDIYKNL